MEKSVLHRRSSLLIGAAALLSLFVLPASAQGISNGSYLRSCNYVGMDGDTLVADCQRVDGSWVRSGLPGAGRCGGDIANLDGQLVCR